MKKTTLVTTLRCDARTVATVARFFASQDALPSSLGGLVRLAIEAFGDMIVNQCPEHAVSTTSDAVDYLRQARLIDLTESTQRGRQLLLRELQLEALPVARQHDAQASHAQASPTQSLSLNERPSVPALSAEEVARRLERALEDEEDFGSIAGLKP